MAGIRGRSGRAKRPWAEALAMAANEIDTASGKRRLRRLAEVTFELALAGDLAAIDHIADRLDGRPAQAVSLDVHDESGSELRGLLASFAAAQVRAQAAIGVIVEGEAVALPGAALPGR